MDVVVGLFVNLAKVKAYRNAVGVARKHFVNWLELCFSAYLGRGGVFRSRAGGVIACDAKKLLRRFVRMEYVWRLYGDVLPSVRFENDSIVIPNYFGRDFRVPFKAEGVAPPSLFNKHYPIEVMNDVVLDIGAYLGDTPLMWLYKGARSVIAVEPVPLHFQYLVRNVEGLPVTCLNMSLAVQLPKIPSHEGSVSYGLFDDVGDELLDVPVVQLRELVERYGPTVVKLNCEGCEHYVLEELSQIPQLGVKKIVAQFHEVRGFDPYVSLAFLEERLGKANKTSEGTIDLTGKKIRPVTIYWLL